jgi:zinc transport system substrate-binding protein
MKHTIALSAAAALTLAGCASSDSTDTAASGSPAAKKPVVVTDMYPTTFAVQQVAGDAVEIVQLAPPGVEPHDYELTPKQVQQIADADLVAYLPDMIPAVQEAVQQEAPDKAVNVAEGITLLEGHSHEEGEEHSHEGGEEHSHEEGEEHSHEEGEEHSHEEGEEHSHEEGEEHSHEWDPHVWLDPSNMTTMGQNVADALVEAGVTADVTGLQQEMAALDEEFSTALASCTIKPMVVSHEAFGYLAAAYGFEQVGISGLSPEAEPSAARMAEISRLVKDQGITTIYFETLVSPAAAEAIAAETGAKAVLLDPIEGNTDDQGYPTIMRANKETLQAGQSCS